MKDTTATGRSPRFLVALVIAVTCALTFAIVPIEDTAAFDDMSVGDLPWGLILRYMLTSALGGLIAGYLLAGLFGRRGAVGWILALIGGGLAMLLAGLLGSFFGWIPDTFSEAGAPSPLVAVPAGALIPIFAFVGRPILFLVWIAVVLATHTLSARAWQG